MASIGTLHHDGRLVCGVLYTETSLTTVMSTGPLLELQSEDNVILRLESGRCLDIIISEVTGSSSADSADYIIKRGPYDCG